MALEHGDPAARLRTVLAENAILVDKDIIADLYNGVEKILRFVGGLLYTSSKQAGRMTARRLSQKGVVSRENAASTLLLSFALAGYARRVEVEDVRMGRKETVIAIRVYESLLGSRVGRKKRPVDQPLAGYLAGWLEEMYGARVDARETHCIARGDPFCRFEVKVKAPVSLDVARGDVFEG